MRHSKKPLAIALSAAALALAGGSAFAAQDLSAGYMVASAADTKAPEAKCGADKKTAEHKCGADKKAAEAKCGEAKCGAEKKPK